MQAVDLLLQRSAYKSDSESLSAMLNGGDYLPMAKVVHLIIWRNAWVWACLTAVSCSV